MASSSAHRNSLPDKETKKGWWNRFLAWLSKAGHSQVTACKA